MIEMKMDVNTVQKSRALAKLKVIRSEANKILRKVLNKMGVKVNRQMKDASPVDTGSLKKAWAKFEFLKDIEGEVKVKVGIRNGSYGTKRKNRKIEQEKKIPYIYGPLVNEKTHFATGVANRFYSDKTEIFNETKKEIEAKIKSVKNS